MGLACRRRGGDRQYPHCSLLTLPLRYHACLAAEDGLYVARGSAAAFTDTGLQLLYANAHRSRLILRPSGDGVSSLDASRYLRAVSLLVYRNEFAGTAWQTPGTRTIEMVLYDASECTSTVIQQDVSVTNGLASEDGGGAAMSPTASAVPAACFANLNTSDPLAVRMCAQAATSGTTGGRVLGLPPFLVAVMLAAMLWKLNVEGFADAAAPRRFRQLLLGTQV